jgi:hypothetical protein
VVGVLHKEAAGDLLEDARGVWAGVMASRAEVLLGGEAGERLGRERGRDDGFDEELGDLLGGGVDLAVDADDASEGGDGIGLEGAAVGLEDGAPVAAPQGLVCLMMATAALVELADELPAGVEVDEVVVAEFLALELLAAATPVRCRRCRARPSGAGFRRSGGCWLEREMMRRQCGGASLGRRARCAVGGGRASSVVAMAAS